MAFPDDSIERFILNARKAHIFINGDEFTDVATDGGTIPTISKQLKMIEDDISGVVGPIIDIIEEAGAMALDGSVRFDQAQVLTLPQKIQTRENIGVDIPNTPSMSPSAIFDFTLGFVDDRLEETRVGSVFLYDAYGDVVTKGSGVADVDYNPRTGSVTGYNANKSLSYLGIRSETFTGWGSGDTGGGFGAAARAPNGKMTAKDWTWPTSTSAFGYGTYVVSGDASNQVTYGLWMRKKTGSALLSIRLTDVTTNSSTSPSFTVDTTWRYFVFTSTGLINSGSVGIGFANNGGSVVAGDQFEIWHPALALGIHPNLNYSTTIDSVVSKAASGLLLDLVEESSLINPTEFTAVAIIDTTYSDSTTQSVIFNLSNNSGDESILMDMFGSQIRGELLSADETINISQNLGPVGTGVRAIGISSSLVGVIGLTDGASATVWNDPTGVTPTGLTKLAIGKHVVTAAKEAGIPIKKVIIYRRSCTQLELAALLTYWN